MHSHYCANHFPKHVAVYSGVCSFPFLHFYSKQHCCPNLLSVIATKLCQSKLLPSVGSASVDTESAASLSFSGCNERGHVLFVKQHAHAKCAYCKMPDIQQSLSFADQWLLKWLWQICKMSSSLCLSVFLTPFFQRKEQHKYLTCKSAPKKAAEGCYYILPFPLLQQWPTNATAVQKQLVLFDQLCPEHTCYRSASSLGVRTYSTLQLKCCCSTEPTPYSACDHVSLSSFIQQAAGLRDRALLVHYPACLKSTAPYYTCISSQR